MPSRRILLVDADAFYVAVARLVDPEGAGREPLLIVGGTRESRGVVCSASYATRRYGVRSAMPIARALRLCPNALCVPVPRRACSEKSEAIRAVLARVAPVVEAASIDEWYLDLAETEGLYSHESLEGTAGRIRALVLSVTGLSVSVGGGTSKLVAKLATGRAKPRPGTVTTGVVVVSPGSEEAFLRTCALADLPLVGERFQEALSRFGMVTVPDALRYDRATLTMWLGERAGAWLYDRVRGIDGGRVEPSLETKSISRDETFATDIDGDDDLTRELLALVTRAASDLRGGCLATRTVTVRIRDYDFKTRQASRTTSAAVISDRVIFGTARALLRKLRAARRVPARLLGIGLSSLALNAEADQLTLFECLNSVDAESQRDRQLARAVDQVRAKFGARGILPSGLI